ncbi:thiol reductant ABC exporter subunit CydD [Marinobacterium sp. AK62]|uniref:Thiol reductant ABC exporter subunit CydD n=1 Tax=Marinobacterium alkalitolerans TaxID=1542925 RepID=A0ABS3ZAB0_9GAMM|nr:thiol reductant ABC exporter subunit CydD [Marinobacterium alkalitolerans]MBP0048641.1 thiol reductant ABC exporter subunit CydD [Marinobacterium alkalitolerans]
MSSRSDKEQRQWLKGLSVSSSRWIQVSVAAGVGSGVLLILQAHLLASVVHDTLFNDQGLLDQWQRFAWMIVILFLRAFLSVVREWAGQMGSTRVRQDLRRQLLHKLERLGPGFTSGERSGRLVSELMEQVEALDGFFARYLPQVSLAALLPLVFLAFVFPVNWAAGLIFLLTAPLIPLFMALVGIKAAEANRRNFEALSTLGAQFLDIVQGIVTLKLFDRSREQADVVARGADDFRVRTMQVLRLAFLSSAVLEFFASISIALVAVYLGFSFLGHLDFGYWEAPVTLYQGLFILLLAPEFYLPLRELGTHYHAKQEAVAAADRLRNLLDQTSLALPAEGCGLEGPVKSLEVCAGQLHYPGRDKPVLTDVNLSLEPGRLVALVGRSGAGKSSLLQVLLGFRALTHGEVRVNGKPLQAIGTSAWLERVAWVSQQASLIPGSLRENLLIAAPNASEYALYTALEQANALEFVQRLPDGLDTQVGERGVGLSGGQIQRLALARAFLKDAPVLLLDEPTANLDRESEQLVLAALESLCQGRLVLMLTHRRASMLKADQVLRLESGRLVEDRQAEVH